MTEIEKLRNRTLAPQLIKALESRNIRAQFAETREEALQMALDIIPKGARVGWGWCVQCPGNRTAGCHPNR